MKQSLSLNRATQQPAASAALACLWLALTLPPNAHAINGLEGTCKVACDARGRIEPARQADGSLSYGAIPIQISIHDALNTKMDDVFYAHPSFILPPLTVHLPPQLVSLGQFRSLRITPLAPVAGATQGFDLASFYEIETTTGDWDWPANPSTRVHRICRRWKAEDPEPFRD